MSAQILTEAISEKLDFISLPKIHLGKILIFLGILTVSLAVFYILQINKITKAAFFIYGQEKEIVVLSQQIRGLEADLSRGNGSADLEAILKMSHYEKVGKVYYIQVMDNSVAVNP